MPRGHYLMSKVSRSGTIRTESGQNYIKQLQNASFMILGFLLAVFKS